MDNKTDALVVDTPIKSVAPAPEPTPAPIDVLVVDKALPKQDAIVSDAIPEGAELLLIDDPKCEIKQDLRKKTRTREEKNADLDLVSEMIAEGKTLREIAAFISSIRPYKINYTQIFHDSKELDSRLLERMIDVKGLPKARAVARLYHVRRKAFEGFERSCLIQTRKRIERYMRKGKGNGTDEVANEKKIQETLEQVGDPAWLRVVIEADKLIAQMEGTLAPILTEAKIEASVSHNADLPALREAYRKAFAQRLGLGASVTVSPPNISNADETPK